MKKNRRQGPVRVSDPSQPEKILLMRVALCGAAFFGIVALAILGAIAERVREIEALLKIISQ